MKAGIIAAGRGERLLRTGVSMPKPLVPVLGEPMIARTIRGASRAGVDKVFCVINGIDRAVEEYLLSNQWPVRLQVIKKTTRNSLESFSLLHPYLEGEPFLIFTVDAVFRLTALGRFLSGARRLSEAHAVLALTRYVDDEKPLFARVDRVHAVREIGEKAYGSPLITAGFYWFRPSVLELLSEARRRRLKAFRQFLCLLPESHCPTYAIAVSRTFDVDRREDMEKAELYLSGEGETHP